jgi:CheY-like chemotaxis protein
MTKLNNLRVLIVEDEAMISLFLEDVLESVGCTVAGVAVSAPEAASLLETVEFDTAILDYNLGGSDSRDIALRLKTKGIPFIFATGYGATVAAEGFGGVPILVKPFTAEDVTKALGLAIKV